jgi:hypothetical protein
MHNYLDVSYWRCKSIWKLKTSSSLYMSLLCFVVIYFGIKFLLLYRVLQPCLVLATYSENMDFVSRCDFLHTWSTVKVFSTMCWKLPTSSMNGYNFKTGLFFLCYAFVHHTGISFHKTKVNSNCKSLMEMYKGNIFCLKNSSH